MRGLQEYYLEAQTLGLSKKVGRNSQGEKGYYDLYLEVAKDKQLTLQSQGNAEGAR